MMIPAPTLKSGTNNRTIITNGDRATAVTDRTQADRSLTCKQTN